MEWSAHWSTSTPAPPFPSRTWSRSSAGLVSHLGRGQKTWTLLKQNHQRHSCETPAIKHHVKPKKSGRLDPQAEVDADVCAAVGTALEINFLFQYLLFLGGGRMQDEAEGMFPARLAAL